MLKEGPGPATLDTLKTMQAATEDLPLPPEPRKKTEETKLPPKPSQEEQDRLIAAARELALDYTKQLPDFICLQITRRYHDPLGENDFLLRDTIATQLSYFGQVESYKLIWKKEKKPGTPANEGEGAISRGEFGTLLREVFQPETKAEFSFQRWTRLHSRLNAVFTYRVLPENSQWSLVYHESQVFKPGYAGLLFIDAETHAVMRVRIESQGIPPSFPIQAAWTQLDYAYQDLSGKQFLLPASGEMNMRIGRLGRKNEIEFRSYRKYSADSDISFETDEANAIGGASDKKPGH
jgi:hypothetical protein